jgi:hypothetical protein
MLRASPSNESRVVQQTVLRGRPHQNPGTRSVDLAGEANLWCVTLSLESAEQGLLSTQDLDGTCGVFAQVGQTAGMADQSCTDTFAREEPSDWVRRGSSFRQGTRRGISR